MPASSVEACWRRSVMNSVKKFGECGRFCTSHSLGPWLNRSVIFTRWHQRASPSNTWFVGPTGMCHPNGISVVSTVFWTLHPWLPHMDVSVKFARTRQYAPPCSHKIFLYKSRVHLVSKTVVRMCVHCV